ncbi:MAG: hypothetical protein ACFBSE_10615, partial [Prochloraceae cyanobacterium]
VKIIEAKIKEKINNSNFNPDETPYLTNDEYSLLVKEIVEKDETIKNKVSGVKNQKRRIIERIQEYLFEAIEVNHDKKSKKYFISLKKPLAEFEANYQKDKKAPYKSPYQDSMYSDAETIKLAEGWELQTGQIIKSIDNLAEVELDLAIQNRQKNAPKRTGKSNEIIVVNPNILADAAALINDFSYEQKFKIGETVKGQDVGYRHFPFQDQFGNDLGRIGGLESGNGVTYPQIKNKLRDLESSEIGNRLNKIVRGEKLPADKYSPIIGELYGLWFSKEGSHRWEFNNKTKKYEPTHEHKRDLIYSKMISQLLTSGKITFEEALNLHPASYNGAQSGAQLVTPEMNKKKKNVPRDGSKDRKARDERYRREKETIQKWFEQYKEQLEQSGEQPSKENIEKFIKEQL